MPLGYSPTGRRPRPRAKWQPAGLRRTSPICWVHHPTSLWVKLLCVDDANSHQDRRPVDADRLDVRPYAVSDVVQDWRRISETAIPSRADHYLQVIALNRLQQDRGVCVTARTLGAA